MSKKIIAVNAGPRIGWNTETLISETPRYRIPQGMREGIQARCRAGEIKIKTPSDTRPKGSFYHIALTALSTAFAMSLSSR